MFPIHDENPSRGTPYATYAIIGLNVLSWMFLQHFGFNPGLAESICEYGLIAGELLGHLAPGAEIELGRGITCVADAQNTELTLLTSMFMHGSWLHIIINMWFLTIFGDNVEDSMGYVRFVIFYLLCGLGAVGVQLLSNPQSAVPMVGASGAIGGVMGGYALLYPRAPVHMLIFLGFFITRVIVPAYFMLGYWFLLQVVSATATMGQEAGGVAFWAHIGGFGTGLALVKLFSIPQLREDRSRRGV